MVSAKLSSESETFTNTVKVNVWEGERHLIELVLLAELHTLFPAVVALEEVGSDSPELNQLVLLQALGQ